MPAVDSGTRRLGGNVLVVSEDLQQWHRLVCVSFSFEYLNVLGLESTADLVDHKINNISRGCEQITSMGIKRGY